MLRRLSGVALAAALILIVASPAHGWSNGNLPESALAPIHGPGFKVKLALGAAASWNNMRLCALRDGVDMYPAGANSALRRVGVQSDFPPPVYGTQWYFWGAYRNGVGALAAYPGTSNHGWGTRVDLARQSMRSYIDRKGRALGWRKDEAPSEWWHVSYYRSVPWPNPGPLASTPVLRLRSGGPCQGPFVKELEARLGFKRPDYFYGHSTAGANRRAEARFGFKHPDGITTAATWARLRVNNTVKVGTRGVRVRVVEGLMNARFRELRYVSRVPVNGYWSPNDSTKVKLLQRRFRISADGQVGAVTLRYLRTPIKPPSSPVRPAAKVPTQPRVAITRISRHQAARVTPVRAIVLHTTEGWYGSGFLPAAAGYFASNSREVSTHITTDGQGRSARSVVDGRRAFHVYKANTYTLGIEQIGTASWTRAQWLTRRAQLDAAARWIAYWSVKYRIPIRRCETRDRTSYVLTKTGVCTHRQFSLQRNDPGVGYPLDVVLKRAQSLVGASG